ncbi:MAG: hypothetical protein GXO39_04470 [Thermotogae bacterium]|nr:hypothetical protein [Thermotogota bacterium]
MENEALRTINIKELRKRIWERSRCTDRFLYSLKKNVGESELKNLLRKLKEEGFIVNDEDIVLLSDKELDGVENLGELHRKVCSSMYNYEEIIKGNKLNRVYGWDSFFELFQNKGNWGEKTKAKEKIKRFFSIFINMAKVEQSIYEFMQNADDAEANKMFFTFISKDNEKFMIFGNNGKKFNASDTYGILSFAESYKGEIFTEEEKEVEKVKEYIGRYGVGFKLIHRLVMEDEGDYDALLEKCYGPIIFSWRDYEIRKLLNIVQRGFRRNIQEGEYSWNLPILFKIVAMIFPVGIEEKIYLFKDEEIKPFKYEDLEILEQLPNKIKNQIIRWKEGSIFIVPLRTKGENKGENLEKQIKEREGIKLSLIFLKNLETIITEEGEIKRPEVDIIDSDIGGKRVIFAFPKNRNKFTNKPNLYKYLPMEMERLGLNFMIHYDGFEIATQRTSLNSRDALKEVFEELKRKLEELKERDRKEYYKYYEKIVISEPNLSDDDKKESWRRFKNTLWDFLKNNIPVKLEDGSIKIVGISQIRINETGLKNEEIPLHKIKENEYWLPKDWEHFFKGEPFEENIKKYEITNLVRDNNQNFSKYMRENINLYDKILEQIANSTLGKTYIEKLPLIKWNNKLYTIDEMREKRIVVSINKNERDNLENIGELINDMKIAEYNENLRKIIENTGIKIFFDDKIDNIVKLLNSYKEKINSENKAKVLKIVIEEFVDRDKWGYKWGWNKWGIETTEDVKELKIFKNCKGEYKPLKDLIPYEDNKPWLEEFMMDKNEWEKVKDIPNIESYLMKEEEAFEKIYSDGKIRNYLKDKDNYENILNDAYERYKNSGGERSCGFNDAFYNDDLSEDTINALKKVLGDDKVVDWEIVKWIREQPGERDGKKKMLGVESKSLSDFLDNNKIDYLPSGGEKLNKDDVEKILNFIVTTKDRNLFNKWAFVREDNGYYRLDTRYKQAYIRQIETVNNENPEDIKRWVKERLKIYIITEDEFNKDLNDIVGRARDKVFAEIKKHTVNIQLSNDGYSVSLEQENIKIPKTILKWIIEESQHENREIEWKINGKSPNEYKPKEFKNGKWSNLGISLYKLIQNEDLDIDYLCGKISEDIGTQKETVKNVIFGTEETKKLSDDEIYRQIKVIDNLHKLIFVLLYNNNKGRKEISIPEVKQQNAGIINLSNIQNWDGINKESVHEEIVGNMDIPFAIVKPFLKGGKYIHYPVNESDPKKDLMEGLYKEYKDQRPEKITFICTREGKCMCEFSKVKNYVYPDEIALEEERIADWLRLEHSENEELFKEFIKAIGIRTGERNGEEDIKLRKLIKEVKL